MSILNQRYRYVVTEEGGAPEWDEAHTAQFRNPVSVGDQIKPRHMGEGLRNVVRVVHYAEGSVLFTISNRSMQG